MNNFWTERDRIKFSKDHLYKISIAKSIDDIASFTVWHACSLDAKAPASPIRSQQKSVITGKWWEMNHERLQSAHRKPESAYRIVIVLTPGGAI